MAKKDRFCRYSMLVSLLGVMLVLLAGCALDSEDGGTTPPAAASMGLAYCYNCHSANPWTTTDPVKLAFSEWLTSSHGNFQSAAGTAIDPYTLRDSNGHAYARSEIVGDPAPSSRKNTICFPCHMGPDRAGDALSGNAGGMTFKAPDIGRYRRYVIGCEACHGEGSRHFSRGYPPPYPVPGFAQCTLCHAQAELDHHGPDSDRAWVGVTGEDLGENTVFDTLTDTQKAAVFHTTHLTVTTSGVQTLTFLFPAYAVSTHALALTTIPNGPYRFEGNQTINDTHFNEVWIESDDLLFKFSFSNAQLGYVDLTNTSPNSGLVRMDSPDACTASCHGSHRFDSTINQEWAKGAHHPVAEGPLVAEDSTVVIPEGPSNWIAIQDAFSESCMRCHHANGFAAKAPAYASTFTFRGKGSFITCNACHDGTAYPTPADRRLRFTGTITLFNYNARISSSVALNGVGDSAVCMYCHQGREDMTRLEADIKANTAGTRFNRLRFRNMHYAPAAAILYAAKGFEFGGKAYVGPGVHYVPGCSGCHMNRESSSKDLGGHTFLMARGTAESSEYCQTTCHGDMTSFDDIGSLSHSADWDSDGATLSAREEVAHLLTVTFHAVLAYDTPRDADLLPQLYYKDGSPYFLSNAGQQPAFDSTLLKAAFNWQFVKKDPGAYAHNPKYAVQLLRDSLEALLKRPYGGSRP